MKDRVQVHCQGLKIWKQPKMSHTKFVRRIIADSTPKVVQIVEPKYMFLNNQPLLRQNVKRAN